MKDSRLIMVIYVRLEHDDNKKTQLKINSLVDYIMRGNDQLIETVRKGLDSAIDDVKADRNMDDLGNHYVN
jgi:hypothetical protein